MKLDPDKLRAFDVAIKSMSDFKRVFGRDLKPDFIAELYVARELNLDLVDAPNEPGYDAIGPDGMRFQVKQRNAQNVDLNNFNFDFLVLVNLDDNYELLGMWRMTCDRAKSVFVWRDKYRKYQTTQDKVKAHADRIR